MIYSTCKFNLVGAGVRYDWTDGRRRTPLNGSLSRYLALVYNTKLEIQHHKGPATDAKRLHRRRSDKTKLLVGYNIMVSGGHEAQI